MKKKDYLIIDRSKWRTGNNSQNKTGKGETVLLNEDGYMCCLGFRCHQMGIPKAKLRNRATPYSLSRQYKIPDLVTESKYFPSNTDFCVQAMSINDSPAYSREERELKIKEHFETKNIIVEFIGKYKKSY